MGGSWAHAVNSRSYLERTLASKACCCIETDIGWNTALQVPVMIHKAHSNNTKDFKLSEFLEMVVGSEWLRRDQEDKTIKLDFKSLDAVAPCIAQVQESGLSMRAGVQVWLNADVLPGPGASAHKPLDFHRFQEACAPLPAAAMSLGWTTGFNKFTLAPNEPYSKTMVDEMLTLTRSLSADRHVIYALRASLVRASWDQLRRLLEDSKQQRTSLSVWTGAEGVPQSELEWMSARVAYFDVHKGSKDEWRSWGRLLALQNVGYSYEFAALLYVAVVAMAMAAAAALLQRRSPPPHTTHAPGHPSP